MHVLTSTAEIQQAVRKLMAPGRRRVAIVAFVGAGASEYVPDPKGMTVICWPKGGGTNPNEVRRLIDKGAEVFFADRVHMKLFWAEDRGAIIGSANLTTNALGAGGLREMVVETPATAVAIDALISSLHPRTVTDEALRELDRQHGAASWNVASKGEPAAKYTDWRRSKFPPPWKLGWWNAVIDWSSAAVRKARLEFKAAPRASIVGRRGEYLNYDWILSFGLGKRRVKDIEWIYSDFVVRYSKAKTQKYQWEAVQVQSNRGRPPPPFALDAKFRSAFSASCREFGFERLKALKTAKVPAALLDLVDKKIQ